MKFLSLAAIGGLSLLAAGCIVIDADVEDDDHFAYSDSAERVYSADISDNEISIRVAASGCTTKDFFESDIDHKGGNSFTVEFERKRRDYCKMLQPNGEKLTWSFAELGLPESAEISLLNPVGS